MGTIVPGSSAPQTSATGMTGVPKPMSIRVGVCSQLLSFPLR